MLPNLNSNILNPYVNLSETKLETILNIVELIFILQMLHVQIFSNDDS